MTGSPVARAPGGRHLARWGGGCAASPANSAVPVAWWRSRGSAADRIADSILRAIRQPEGVDVDAVVVRPIGLPEW